jgi:Uma2 family endonuclease
MNSPAAIPAPPNPGQFDQHVVMHALRWQDYETLLAIRGDRATPRLTYLEGDLELMTPALEHETAKTLLGRLIETYAEERGLDLQGCGSWTVRAPAKGRGVEPDECYVLGVWTEPPAVPDLAIEVVWTSGGIDKLEVYRGLGVPEVWFWQNSALRIHHLEDDAYVERPRSRLLPDLDPNLIVRFMGYRSQIQAVQGLRAALRS